MWLLLVSVKGGYKLHSVHKTEADAKSWEKCKQHDGEDTHILMVDKEGTDMLQEFLDSLE